ncbi:alkylation response protein AidB-like acyl-CoA dehydrogenase [Streptomyces sp. LBL]|uniref:acyl-CoA dehydrogenase family protein n=1 Tax=Streptomyces sp. LBL TaxID=2940562 RepID=UPI0024732DDA|nr:acyl-CoA dehydrogenase family protein [Streptomyces sp. LBL]MDH6628968.1 alkylation response protein AidB-like acyl-CoA dehydrogenase [Streptomyces sp. LBL]
MRFHPTEDQRALRDGVRQLLARRFDSEALRAAVAAPRLDRVLWRELGEAGFFALRLPETEGGVGLGLPEAALVFEEAGRVLLPGPLIATHLAAGAVPGAAEGEVVVAAVDGGLVEWWGEADVVRGATAEGAGPEGVVPLRSVDPLTPLHRVSGTLARSLGPSSASASASASAASPASGSASASASAAPVAIASLLTAAEQLGTATRACELAVQHARAREQFGQPIGGFQAVKHLCADMLVRAEVARAAVYAAAVTADPTDIAAARLLADEAAQRNTRDCLQVHGGMGFTWESDVHLHLKRAWVRSRRGGGGTESEDRLAEELVT